jgi:hypothetical protein
MPGIPRWLVFGLCLILASPLLSVAGDPTGILIAKLQPTASMAGVQVIEYFSINEQLVPALNYLTAILPNGSSERIQKAAILQRVEYPLPGSFPSILNYTDASTLLNLIQRFNQAETQYEQARRYLEPRIAPCPFCRRPMVLRTTRTNSHLWGCPQFPRCRGKRNVRYDLFPGRAYQPR